MSDPRPLILVAGATGYIGRRLVNELVAHGERVRCLARSPEKLASEPWRSQVEVVPGDVLDAASLTGALSGVDVAYYLVHSMSGTGDWERRDRAAAELVRDAAAGAGTGRIVYLGGLGSDTEALSPHLRSRHEVGRILAGGPVPVTELRAATIIGSGSASFEMLRNLVEVLPVMVTPKWVDTRCQPIAIRDVLTYLVAVLDEPATAGRILEIGGTDVLTYREMMQVFAEEAGLRRRLVVPVPFLTPRLSSLWIGLVTPLPVPLARTLVDSLVNEVIVHDHTVEDLVPHEPLAYRRAVQLALRRVEDLAIATRWTDADWTPADPMPTDAAWAGGTVLEDEQVVTVAAPPAEVFRVVSGLGGERGWLVADPLWRLRGLADRLVGGVGMRRGRRHPDDLRVGDALDFWRVETLVPDRLLRLRAEMKLPGEAWLEWRVEHDPPGERTRLYQRARFHPRGLLGRAYWYALAPFHRMIFRPMARRIGRLAEERADPRRSGPRSGAPGTTRRRRTRAGGAGDPGKGRVARTAGVGRSG
ncbi:MAG: NAD(P)-dependent oxidoreductase [Acidimicrobiia bacterium]|nr:MAG: NAD(P)-dependent oxidoreductase [Acidimicrobiia bacterium]